MLTEFRSPNLLDGFKFINVYKTQLGVLIIHDFLRGSGVSEKQPFFPIPCRAYFENELFPVISLALSY